MTSQVPPPAVTVVDALTYLTRIKHEFIDAPHVYEAFLTIMKQFKAQAIDAHETARRVAVLFQHHPHLRQGFCAFLPPNHSM